MKIRNLYFLEQRLVQRLMTNALKYIRTKFETSSLTPINSSLFILLIFSLVLLPILLLLKKGGNLVPNAWESLVGLECLVKRLR